jgi:hypothetical protein
LSLLIRLTSHMAKDIIMHDSGVETALEDPVATAA